MLMQKQTRCSLYYYCQAGPAAGMEEVEERCTDLLWSMMCLLVLLVLLPIASLLLPVRKSSWENNLGYLEVGRLCKDRRLVMFGWMMGFAMIGRCWDWHFENVEYVLVLASCCLSVVVLKLEESRNAAGFEFVQE